MSTTADPNEQLGGAESNQGVVAEEIQPAPAPGADEDYDDAHGTDRRFLIFQAMPAWGVSALVHILILLILGLVSIANPMEIVNVITASTISSNGPEIEELSIEDFDPGEIEEPNEVTEEVEVNEVIEEVQPVELQTPMMDMVATPIDISDFAAEVAPTMATMQQMSAISMKPMTSRTADMKEKLLREYGGTETSEIAVTEALKWFARHQIKKGPQTGAWTMQHEIVCGGQCDHGCRKPQRAKQLNAATAMALLPFLGAGQTHLKGDFRDVVMRGLRFLVQNGKPGKEKGLPYIDYTSGGSMYDHGLAAITLCEAYAMTGDPDLAGPSQAALNFIALSQCKDGGWRYSKNSKTGDTSVVGWQVMALKSGHMGHLVIPPNVIAGASRFLDLVGSDQGSLYGYTSPITKAKDRKATVAVGLLCRMYMGWDKNHPGIKKGVQHLSKLGVVKPDLYYNYYAAQVLRHHGGQEWDKFNTELRDWLVATQDKSKGAKGSWWFDRSPHMSDSGRLCLTSFATMILEVYYRHMPLYAEVAAEEEFPL